MAIKFTDTQHYADIADAIRGKNGSSDTYTPAEMAQAIEDIPSGGGMPQALADLIAGTATGAVDLTLNGPAPGLGILFSQHTVNTGVTSLTIRGCTQLGFYKNSGRSGICIDDTATNLETISLPDCTYLVISKSNGYTRFFPKLKTFNVPNLISLHNTDNGFRNCSLIEELILPKLTSSISGSYCQGCTALTTVDVATGQVQNQAFDGCTSLTALVLRSSTVAAATAPSILNNTPIANGTGYIYVPRALITTYQAATNWTTYANQFRALEDYTSDGTINGDFVPPTA